ncbi:hypothetical protein GN109_05230 [Collimonas pratensis]|uniref:hypothetical protein n=1 Tax=Collimonas pratensis TaxID=279113 RepID=UPI00143D803A|nr:hypothetical protein [Collimonas pratensis]NKI68816.1 hypothetical protein [Collimonas pratensis]
MKKTFLTILAKISLILIIPFWIMDIFLNWWMANGGYKPYGPHPSNYYFWGVFVLSISIGLTGVQWATGKSSLKFQIFINTVYILTMSVVLMVLAAAPAIANI